MKRILVLVVACALLSWGAFAQEREPRESQEKPSREPAAKQNPGGQSSATASGSASTSASAQAGQNSANLSSDTTFQAALSQSLDARKNKEGDKVTARTTQDVKQDGQVILPKGSRLVGHVTQAKARAKGQTESALGVAFDHAILKNGEEMPLNVFVQAIGTAQSAASIGPAETDIAGGAGGMASGQASGSHSGGLVGTAGSAVGGAASTVTNTAGAASGAVGATASTATSAAGSAAGHSVTGALTSSSSGVIGLQGLTLDSQASNTTQGSVIASSTKNVHLDSGTRLLLHARGQ